MEMRTTKPDLRREIEGFVKGGFKPHFGELRKHFETNPTWQRLREIGSELWLDTGSIEDSRKLWTQEFSALTTNNTLLNREVQTGRYDSLVCEAARMLAAYPELSEKERMLEIAFILNAWHGLRLVETFDAYVSVEEHTGLAYDVEGAVEYARRYHAICPERFIVKIPLTSAGLLATRRVSAEGIPVNHTLGFSARQNYMIARIGRPAYVNVFLGRLNSFVVDNNLGDGSYVGEKATLASQGAIRELRQRNVAPTRQIGASFRAGPQVRDLLGIDVMTMPPKVASEFLSMGMSPDQLTEKTVAHYSPGMSENVDREAIRLDTLWDIEDELVACLDALEKENIDSFTPDDLIDFFAEHGCADVLVCWSESQIETSTAEGKIPKLENWRDALAGKAIGLDSLMNLAGLRSFATDQKAMDDRVRQVLEKGTKA
ncbi:MAG: transaldolase family protein [Planctomycetota bacterium]|jgi:transaldolase